MRRLVVAAAVALHVAVPAAAAPSGTVYAGPGGATVVAAGAGWRAWSERPLFSSEWRVVVRAPRANLRYRPAIAPRTVPFDLDIGRDEDGNDVAAYSRCDRDPALDGAVNPYGAGGLPQYASGEGCSVRVLNLTAGTERSIDRGRHRSVVLPSIAAGRLAFVADRGGRASVILHDLATGRERVLYSGPLSSGDAGAFEGPTSLDIDGRSYAVAWRVRDGRTARTRILVGRFSAERPRIAATATDPAGPRFAAVLAPTIHGGTVSYLQTSGTGFCERRYVRPGRRPDFGVRYASDTESPVSAALDARGLVVADAYGPRENSTEDADTAHVVEFERSDYTRTAPEGC